MQKKQNPRSPKYYSFTVSRDSFVDLRKLNTIDTQAQVLIPCVRNKHKYDFCDPNPPIQKKSPLDKPINRLTKRTIDILLSVVVIIGLLSWLLPIWAILIKLGKGGPVLLLQKRKKRNGQLFTCIRFSIIRSARGLAIQPSGEINRKINAAARFLQIRKLDALPQFFNVLIGDMAVIGPCSHPDGEALKYEKIFPSYSLRYSVKPGITGLEQVSGLDGSKQNVQGMKSRTRLDLYYVHHWSGNLDFKILLQSLRKMAGLRVNYSQKYFLESF